MKTLDIYRGASLLVTIKPDNTSIQSKTIMGANELRITFEDSRYINFQINDTCSVFGEIYIIDRPVIVTKSSTLFYKYSLTMVVEGSLLARYQFLFLGADNSLRESDFSLMGSCEDFLNLVVANANRAGSGWIKGQYVVGEYKNLTFSKENCYNALGRIAEAFEVEFWILGKTIHLAKLSTDTGRTFRQGRFKGLYEITRQAQDNSSIATRLYAYGAEKNLPPDYRNYSKRLQMTDGILFVENNIAKYGVIEYTELFEDIFPTRTGKVTSVNAANPYIFIDTAMDFDLNSYLLPGLTAKVTFNTGQLAGYEFELSAYNAGTKQFTILKNKNERVLDIPSTLLKPAIGDEYVLTDIMLPQPYIDAAEARLKLKAEEFLAAVSEPQLKYQIVFDPTYLKVKGFMPSIGDLVWLVDEELQVDRRIRITSASRNIVKEMEVSVELADVISVGKIDIIVNGQAANERQISSIGRLIQNRDILNNNMIGDQTLKQGSLIMPDIPTSSGVSGFSELIIDNITGKIYKKV